MDSLRPYMGLLRYLKCLLGLSGEKQIVENEFFV
jgi:hypothetical protein